MTQNTLKALPVAAAMTVLLSLSAQARLEETPEQCEKRYGKPTSESATRSEYAKNGFSVVVTWHDGKADSITINLLRGRMSQVQIDLLLKANCKNWSRISESCYQSDPGGCFAIHRAVSGALMISTEARLIRLGEEHVQSVDGF